MVAILSVSNRIACILTTLLARTTDLGGKLAAETIAKPVYGHEADSDVGCSLKAGFQNYVGERLDTMGRIKLIIFCLICGFGNACIEPPISSSDWEKQRNLDAEASPAKDASNPTDVGGPQDAGDPLDASTSTSSDANSIMDAKMTLDTGTSTASMDAGTSTTSMDAGTSTTRADAG